MNEKPRSEKRKKKEGKKHTQNKKVETFKDG